MYIVIIFLNLHKKLTNTLKKNMKNFIFSFFILFLFFESNVVTAQTQFETDGVIVPRTIPFQNSTLQLNGFGTRSKMWVDVYVQALYVTSLSQDAQYIINGETEMAIRIQIKSSMVSSAKFSKNFDKGFEQSAGKDIYSFKPRIELFKKMLKNKIVKEDIFTLAYNPKDESVWVYKNNDLKGKIPGLDFKKILFGIWLSDNPVDEGLKKELLGKE